MQRTAVGWLQENPASHEEEKEGEHDTLHDSRPLHWQEDASADSITHAQSEGA